VKFLVDIPLSPRIAEWLVERGHEADHASFRNLSRADDRALLELGRGEGRIILTADLDYPRLLATTLAGSPGIILFRGGDFNEQEAILGLERMFSSVSPDQLASSIIVIERQRIRRRPLPISQSSDNPE